MPADDRGVNSLRNLTQLIEGCVDLPSGPLELRGRAAVPGKLLLEQVRRGRPPFLPTGAGG